MNTNFKFMVIHFIVSVMGAAVITSIENKAASYQYWIGIVLGVLIVAIAELLEKKGE